MSPGAAPQVYQDPPPPPPKPPPEDPPAPNPLLPEEAAVATMVPEVVTAKLSIEWPKLPSEKGYDETYHELVLRAISSSSPANARAHFSVQPKTTANGRYSENRLARSAKRARSFSLSSMNRRKPVTRR